MILWGCFHMNLSWLVQYVQYRVFNIIAAELLVSLTILINCSNVWICLVGSHAFPLVSLIILTRRRSCRILYS